MRTARLLGHRRGAVVDVPVLSPMLSAQWIRLVTMADWSVARALVDGLTSDLLARGDEYWQAIGHHPLDFNLAARRALEDETNTRRPRLPEEVLEAAVDLVTGSPCPIRL